MIHEIIDDLSSRLHKIVVGGNCNVDLNATNWISHSINTFISNNVLCRCRCDALFECLTHILQLECGPMANVMAALSNIGGALCSTPQSFADAHYWSGVQ